MQENIGKFLPKKIDFNFDFITTDRSHNYIFGDLKFVKEFYNSGLNEDELEKKLESITLFENKKLNNEIKNYFHLSVGGLPGIHIYYSKIKEELDFIFIPSFLFEQIGAYTDSAKAFVNNNEEFKENILDLIDSKNTNWTKLGQIRTPSLNLYFGQPIYANWKYEDIEHNFEFKTQHKSFDIFSVLADRSKLAEIYNSQYNKFNYVDLELLQRSNDNLPKDKAYHGILILGNSS
ncbi:hypothetical protein HIMB5_00012190 [alpha proteobacterium HIMB5]|nr:hypothetical protein HIMB5_00012190 [alpha proteobacterium HIMB5]